MHPCINATMSIIEKLQHNFPKLRGGSKAVWIFFFKKSSDLVAGSFPDANLQNIVILTQTLNYDDSSTPWQTGCMIGTQSTMNGRRIGGWEGFCSASVNVIHIGCWVMCVDGTCKGKRLSRIVCKCIQGHFICTLKYCWGHTSKN